MIYTSLETLKDFHNTMKRLSLRINIEVNQVITNLKQNDQWRQRVVTDTTWRRYLDTDKMIQTVLHYIFLRGTEPVRSLEASIDATQTLLQETVPFEKYIPLLREEINHQIQKLWFIVNLRKPLKPFYRRFN